MTSIPKPAQRSPYRFLIWAAALAALFSLMPLEADAPQEELSSAAQTESGTPAGADLSKRTQPGCYLHRTTVYAPCGHSVQRRETLPAALVGLSREALSAQLGDLFPGAQVTGFSSTEVDIAQKLPLPCPLHFMLIAGEEGLLEVRQNLSGEAMALVRTTDIRAGSLPSELQAQMAEGMIFDSVQALEGLLESIGS